MEQRDPRTNVVKSHSASPRKIPSTAWDVESSGGDGIPPAHRRTPNTPHLSPHKYPKTPQSGESSKRERSSSQLEHQKRKGRSPSKGSPEKIPKRCNSGYFADSMIRQWTKHVGIQSPFSQTEENVLAEEMKQMCALKDVRIQKLMKKLETAEETISSLSGRLQTQQEASTEILKELNNDGELISNYCRELAEGLKGFQEHKDNLSEMYNVILVNQRDYVEKLQNELSAVKVNDEECKKNINTMRNQVMKKEERIRELEIVEIEWKKQLQDLEEKSMLERNKLLMVHADEISQLTKRSEYLTSTNQELQIQLQRIVEEKEALVKDLQLIENKYNHVHSNYANLENKLKAVQTDNLNLEKSLKDVQHNDEKKIFELNRKIRVLEMEKERVYSEKSLNAKEIENYYKSREEKYKAEIEKLKEDYNVQATEMKKIEAEYSALIKSREDEHKVEIEKLKENYDVQLMEMKKNEAEHSALIKSREDEHKVEIEKLKENYDVQLMEMKKNEAEHSALIKSREDEHKVEIQKLKQDYDVQLMEMKKIEVEHSALIKSREDEHKVEIEKLKQDYDVQLMEMKKIEARNSALLKSWEDEHKVEIEKLKGDYDVQLTKMKKIEAWNSALIKSREDDHKAEIEKLKKDYDAKLTEINEQNKIIQEKESFEKLQKYLQEREEKQKLEDARIQQATREIANLGKYLKERDENLFRKEKEVLEKLREDVKETTDDRKYDDRQVDEEFKSVENCRKEKKADRSGQEEEELNKLPMNVNKNVPRTRKSAKVIKVASVSEIEFDNLLKDIKEKDRNELTQDSPIKAKRAVRKRTKPVMTETVKETGNQVQIDQLLEGVSKNSFSGRSEEMSLQQMMREDEYDFISEVERTYSKSQREAGILKENTLSHFDDRIEKIKGKNEVSLKTYFSCIRRIIKSANIILHKQNKDIPSPKKIFTTGLRQYSKPKSQPRKWGKF
ncbi:uveal autoantigen with coiled-coil domains and ankyrin repeats protein-like isoform X2 [Ceratina calcarata]|uniref:Uveal autoantigen with coiled-coil domains and ankyrin repeats protein-like isoform X2 n=1 Tax=Ceratina calcarata TaxID=156304 RepID=A0AAJ7N586_9HYME|nr:uveal autoantigen with coiled-coil domains and ankyrin repeats protein-like isoform X2 [Ceratina calcarata]